MAKQNNPKPKQRAIGGLAGLSKARAEADKRIKAMTPAQRKAYQSENKKNAVKAVAAAALLTPTGRVASVAGKVVAKAAAKKYGTKAGANITKVYTQGKNARIVNKAPNSAGGGVSSPVKKTKTLVQNQKRGSSPLQQSSFKEGRTVRQNVKSGIGKAKVGIASSLATDAINNRKKK